MSKTRKLLTVAIFGLAAIGGLAWLGWSQLYTGTTEGTERRLRYGNVSIRLPPEESDHSGFSASADYSNPESPIKPGGGPIIVVSDMTSDMSLVIDATTGDVLVDEFRADQRAAIDDIIASVQVESAAADDQWPVADIAPTGPRVTHISDTNLSFIQPAPESGIIVLPGEGGGTSFLFVHNGRSRMVISGETGEMGESYILPGDLEAFERFAASVAVEDAR